MRSPVRKWRWNAPSTSSVFVPPGVVVAAEPNTVRSDEEEVWWSDDAQWSFTGCETLQDLTAGRRAVGLL